MKINGSIHTFSKELKLLIGTFIIVLSIGFYSGLLFVNNTSSASLKGIEENYLGNESDENATVMKFKKSEREMLSIVHSHILSMAMIFFFVGLILLTTSINSKLKMFLIIEPFLSIIVTFGSIYLLWKGITFMKYIIIISGSLMTISYTAMIIIILKELYKSQKHKF